MLEDMGCVTPGKGLNELKVLFLGRESFENLPEKEIVEIYDLHQREIIAKAKKSFQELLLERADLFYQFRSSPAGTVTQDDILDIADALQEDSRWKALDRLDADRKLLLFQHLGFVHCPIREHCPAFPHCIDSLVERVANKKRNASTSSSSSNRPSSWSATGPDGGIGNHLNLVILGERGLADDLNNAVKGLCNADDEFEDQNQIYSLDYRVISGDVSLPENAFRTQDFLPNGCFCSYSDSRSFEYVRTSFEQTLLHNLEDEDASRPEARLPFQGLPLVIVFAPDPSLSHDEVARLSQEGRAIAESLQWPFVEVMRTSGKFFDDRMIDESLRALIDCIRRRSGILNVYNAGPQKAPGGEPDIRIIMCMLCGDPFSVENVLSPLLRQPNCRFSGERTVQLETVLVGDAKRKIEVIISSYHSATDFREELIHGFILVYSTKRKASLATLSTFSMNIPELPIQVLAVTEDSQYQQQYQASSATLSQQPDLEARLISEGGHLADRLNAHFMTSTSALQQKSSFYTPFFKEVLEKKSEIEQAFSMEEDNNRLDDSGEGTLERPRILPPGGSRHRQPMPPPRVDSYRHPQQGATALHGRPPPPQHPHHQHHMNPSRSGSGSEIYERLPEDRGSLRSSDSEDDDVMMGHKNGEHLVKPSQIRSKKQQGNLILSNPVT